MGEYAIDTGGDLSRVDKEILECVEDIEIYTLKSISAIKQSAEYGSYSRLFGKYKIEFQKILDAFLNNRDEYKGNKWSILNNLRIEDGEFI